MTGSNQIHLTLENNPDLTTIFAGKTAGDEIELKCVCGTIQEVDGNRAIVNVDSVHVDGEEESAAETKSDPEESGETDEPAVKVKGLKKSDLLAD